jgi:hypothetical protein
VALSLLKEQGKYSFGYLPWLLGWLTIKKIDPIWRCNAQGAKASAPLASCLSSLGTLVNYDLFNWFLHYSRSQGKYRFGLGSLDDLATNSFYLVLHCSRILG